MMLRDAIGRCYDRLAYSETALKMRMPDVDPATRAICRRVAPYTMTSAERIASVCDAIRYVTAANIPGDYVECGVWRGGSSMAAALALMAAGDQSRTLHLFDTYEGMSAPSAHDVRAGDRVAAARLLERADTADKIWCRASIEDVRANMASTGYPMERVVLTKGKVEDTLPAHAPATIAVLRLDTDWYESTRHELEHLYPLLSPGGVLIVDDYGYWAGARQAVDEYFAASPILLNRVDRTGRIAIKRAA